MLMGPEANVANLAQRKAASDMFGCKCEFEFVKPVASSALPLG